MTTRASTLARAATVLALLAAGGCASRGEVQALRSEVQGLRGSVAAAEDRAARAESEARMAAERAAAQQRQQARPSAGGADQAYRRSLRK